MSQVNIYVCSNTETILSHFDVPDYANDIDREEAAIAFVEAANQSLNDCGLFASANIENESNFHRWSGGQWNAFGLIATWADLSPRRQDAMWAAAEAAQNAATKVIDAIEQPIVENDEVTEDEAE